MQDELYALGAKYTASTDVDYTEYVTLGPRDALPSLLKLESQRISDPLKGVSNDTLLVSKEVLKSRPSLVGGSPMNIARPYMYSMLYSRDTSTRTSRRRWMDSVGTVLRT